MTGIHMATPAAAADARTLLTSTIIELLDIKPGDNSTYQRGTQLVMLGLLDVPSISSQRMKDILAELSAQQQRLATDLPFFRSRATDIQSAVTHLADRCFTRKQECRQLLQREPQLLRQLVLVTAAALRQLTAQLGRDADVNRTVGALADTLAWVVPTIRERPCHHTVPSTRADTAHLQMMRDAGGAWAGG